MIPSYVYVDGFNLYYSALKKTPYKWLNLLDLVNKLLPKNRVDMIKYFTARISARPEDPDQPTRQQTYFRALQTLPNNRILANWGRGIRWAGKLPGDHPITLM